jgi:integration host factor subunit alpha
MTLTKTDIVQIVKEETGLPKNKSGHVVEQLLEIIKRSLASGDDVLISGFGKFFVCDKSERRGRNPVNGESLMLSARRVVTFKCSGTLRNRCNAGKCGDGD